MTHSAYFFDPDGNRFRALHRLPVECAARDEYSARSAADCCFQEWLCTIHLMLCIVDMTSETADALKASLFLLTAGRKHR
jgi:hypothetical protein